MSHEYTSCTRKVRYATEVIASGEAAALNESGANLSVYGCAYCRGWHLTSHGSAGTVLPMPASPKVQDPKERRRWEGDSRQRERRKHGKKSGHGRPKW